MTSFNDLFNHVRDAGSNHTKLNEFVAGGLINDEHASHLIDCECFNLFVVCPQHSFAMRRGGVSVRHPNNLHVFIEHVHEFRKVFVLSYDDETLIDGNTTDSIIVGRVQIEVADMLGVWINVGDSARE
jgi:hypothetical protein